MKPEGINKIFSRSASREKLRKQEPMIMYEPISQNLINLQKNSCEYYSDNIGAVLTRERVQTPCTTSNKNDY